MRLPVRSCRIPRIVPFSQCHRCRLPERAEKAQGRYLPRRAGSRHMPPTAQYQGPDFSWAGAAAGSEKPGRNLGIFAQSPLAATLCSADRAAPVPALGAILATRPRRCLAILGGEAGRARVF
jgi:hypothetical protein